MINPLFAIFQKLHLFGGGNADNVKAHGDNSACGVGKAQSRLYNALFLAAQMAGIIELVETRRQ